MTAVKKTKHFNSNFPENSNSLLRLWVNFLGSILKPGFFFEFVFFIRIVILFCFFFLLSFVSFFLVSFSFEGV